MNKEFRVLEDDLDYDIDPYVPSWEGKFFTGIAYEENEFGVLVSETAYVNGKKHGYFNEYNFGRISFGFYKGGKPYGLWRYFYENGGLKSIKLYCLTKKMIQAKEWDIEGNLKYIKWNNKFGPYSSTIYSKEEFFDSNRNLICEKISEAGVLIEQKKWDKLGNLSDHYRITQDSQEYNYWQECKANFTIENTFTFSK